MATSTFVATQGGEPFAQALSLWRVHWAPWEDWTTSTSDASPGLSVSQLRLHPAPHAAGSGFVLSGVLEYGGAGPFPRARIEVHDPVSQRSWWHVVESGADEMGGGTSTSAPDEGPDMSHQRNAFVVQGGAVQAPERLVLRLHTGYEGEEGNLMVRSNHRSP